MERKSIDTVKSRWLYRARFLLGTLGKAQRKAFLRQGLLRAQK